VKPVLAYVAAGALLVLAVGFAAARGKETSMQIGNPRCGTHPGHVGHGTPLQAEPGHALAVFAQGCFWGVEERFRRVPGVVATAVGYTGGHVEDPSYEDVCTHTTGHTEAVLVEFDPKVVSYAQLLDFFWKTHDPTSGDRQGPDVGSNYRSAVYTFGPEQQAEALASRDAFQKRLADRITTEIAPAGRFWVAEDYHQQWDEKHGYLSCPVPHAPRAARAGAATTAASTH
jgi:peptide-methionine (S)-S-oxide reductase